MRSAGKVKKEWPFGAIAIESLTDVAACDAIDKNIETLVFGSIGSIGAFS